MVLQTAVFLSLHVNSLVLQTEVFLSLHVNSLVLQTEVFLSSHVHSSSLSKKGFTHCVGLAFPAPANSHERRIAYSSCHYPSTRLPTLYWKLGLFFSATKVPRTCCHFFLIRIPASTRSKTLHSHSQGTFSCLRNVEFH